VLRFGLITVLIAACGCNRQDADALGRIGNRLLERVQQSTGGMREKLQGSIHDIGKNGLSDRVHARLMHDRLLQGLPIEITAQDTAIELKGALKTADQKRRAIDLAESTEGVVRVVDSLTVPETPALP